MSTLEAATRELSTSRYLNLVAFVILYYEYGITASLEYERYWVTSGVTLGACLYFVLRYASVFGHIPVILHVFFANGGPMCDAMLLYHQIFAILIQALVATLLIVRTYALYNRDRKILGLMVGCAICGGAIACWAVLTPHGPTPPQPIGVGCNVSLSDLQGIYFAVAWSIMLLFDCLIFGLTLVRAICLSRTVRRTLFDIMLRDGTMYFACMAGANLGNIVTFLVCPPGLKGVPTTFTNVISTTLISRLMINIRDPKILQRSQVLTTTAASSGIPLTNTSNLPYYSTLFPMDGDVFVPGTSGGTCGTECYELGRLEDNLPKEEDS